MCLRHSIAGVSYCHRLILKAWLYGSKSSNALHRAFELSRATIFDASPVKIISGSRVKSICISKYICHRCSSGISSPVLPWLQSVQTWWLCPDRCDTKPATPWNASPGGVPLQQSRHLHFIPPFRSSQLPTGQESLMRSTCLFWPVNFLMASQETYSNWIIWGEFQPLSTPRKPYLPYQVILILQNYWRPWRFW